MILYTAQYSYTGKDRLDITIKGQDPVGKIFAPTWKMVMTSKQGKLRWEEYSAQYRQLLRQSYLDNREQWDLILKEPEVTLVCFCKAGTLCHRYLLADYLTRLGANYLGERGFESIFRAL
jgi:uncharacterized protein YeaO (DUF488 family)